MQICIYMHETVSIPHRFNSHMYFKFSGNCVTFGFNPSQVQFTLVERVKNLEKQKLFQSLTGSIHTNIRQDKINFQDSFNPSQVQFTLIIWKIVPGSLNCFNPSQVQFTQEVVNCRCYIIGTFQSLTGSIHTISITFWDSAFYSVSIPHRFNSHRK